MIRITLLTVVLALFTQISAAQEATDGSVVDLATQLPKEGYKKFTLEGDWLGRKYLIGQKNGEKVRLKLDIEGQPLDIEFLIDTNGDGKFVKRDGSENPNALTKVKKAISRLDASDEIKLQFLSKLKEEKTKPNQINKFKDWATSESDKKSKDGMNAKIERKKKDWTKSVNDKQSKDKVKSNIADKIKDKITSKKNKNSK